MSREKFDRLAATFPDAYDAIQRESLQRGEIKQVPSGGPNGHLDSFDKKLFFLLYYLKTYPAFDVLGFHFGLSAGHACDHVQALLPVLVRPRSLRNSLNNMVILPLMGWSAPVADRKTTPVKKPVTAEKKRHTLKAIAVTTLHRQILFLLGFFVGSLHDYTLMKQIFNPQLKWFHPDNVWLNLGFQGA